MGCPQTLERQNYRMISNKTKQIYVLGKLSKTFFAKLLSMSSALEGENIVLWSYPELSSNASSIFLRKLDPFFIGRQKKERVTSYGDNEIHKIANCYKFNQELFEILLKDINLIRNSFDSIAIYKKSRRNWVCCSIFHENVTIFRLVSEEIKMMEKMKIPFSLTAPEWW